MPSISLGTQVTPNSATDWFPFAGSSGDKLKANANDLRTSMGVEAGATADMSDVEIRDAYFREIAIASQGEMEAGTLNEVRRMTPLSIAQAIAAQTSGGTVLNKYDGTVDPTINDDANDGYSIGSVWINTVSQETFRCIDPTVAAAVWIQTSLSAEELAPVAISGSAQDLTEGATKKLMTPQERQEIIALRTDTDQASFWAQSAVDVLTRRFTQQALSINAGIVNWNLAFGCKALLTMTENVTALNLLSVNGGDECRLRVVQPSSGSTYTMNLGGFLWAEGNVIALSTAFGARDSLFFDVINQSEIWCSMIKNGS